ncbi:MAG: hypothetical protein BWK78_03085 [Thiotrichaceae bacterium IS1]|nr:MAG: hypothetical protein BWK78_03085 [Thiotrichaceae bacterium IS1]
MLYYYLEPEVAGELGGKSEMDASVHPPKVTRLYYQFDGWLGDDLLESFPCFIVSKPLKESLEKANFVGYSFDCVKITKSKQFKGLYPNKKLPDFFWMKIVGEVGKDDFGIAKNHKLVVSERALNLLRNFNINHCEVAIYE